MPLQASLITNMISSYDTRTSDRKLISPAMIVVILNPSHVTLRETKGLVVQLRTGSVKDLVTA
jgi:hypothetical protein